MNRRALSVLMAVAMIISATFSAEIPTYAADTEISVAEETETVEESIMDSVNEILEKKDAADETVDAADGEITDGEAAAENAEAPVTDGGTAGEVIIGGEITGDETAAGDISDDETDVVIATVNETVEGTGADIELTATAEDGTVVVLSAEAAAFPYDDLALAVSVVDGTEAEEAAAEIDAEKPQENTAKRVTYDVQVQSAGVEVQPAEGKKVNVSFKVADAPSGADEVTVYHHDEAEDELVEIASAELTDGTETAAVGTSAGSGTEGAETNVVICNTDAENTSACASSDTDDENYEDYELIDDVTVSGETTSFSYYTVDFTYEQKEVSIDGDTDHNELSKVLAEIGITEDIVSAAAYMDEACTQPAANNTVTVDGKDLFRVYEEGGVWYVDAINAFGTTHGLLVVTRNGEYKVKVTDASIIYIAYVKEGVNMYINGSAIYQNYTREGHIRWWHEEKSVSSNQMEYEVCYSYGLVYYDYITAVAQEGYRLTGWDAYKADGIVHIKPKVSAIPAQVYVVDDIGGTVSQKGNVEVRLSAPIETDGNVLKIGGTNGTVTITATPDANYKFVEWDIQDNATKVFDNMLIIARFAKDPAVCKKVTAAADGSGFGTVTVEGDGLAEPNGTIELSGSTSTNSEILGISGNTFRAKANSGCYFIGWTSDPASALTSGKITEDTKFTAHFVDNENQKTITLVDAIGGSYQTTGFTNNSVQVPNGATFKVGDGSNGVPKGTIELADGSISAKASPSSSYKFVEWQDDAGNVLSGTFSVNEPMNVHAEFKLDYYSEQKLEFQCHPDIGGTFTDGSKVSDSFIFCYTPEYGVKVEEQSDKTLKITDIGNGTTQIIKALCKPGFVYADPLWTNIPTSLDFHNITIEANFEQGWSVTAQADDAGRGTVTPDTTGWVKKGASITGNIPDDLVHSSTLTIGTASFIASPSDNCYFIGWKSDPTDVLTNGTVTDNTTFTAQFVNMGNPKTVKALKTIGGKLTTTGFTDGSVQVPENATIKVNGSTVEIADGSVKLEAVPDTNYAFVGWIDGKGNSLNQITSVTEDMSIGALYRMNTAQSVIISATTGGNLVYRGETKSTVIFNMSTLKGTKITQDFMECSRLIIQYTDTNGNDVTESIDAVASPGYKLKGGNYWSGIPTSISFTEANITANFEIDEAYIEYKVEGNGGIYRNGNAISGTREKLQTGKNIVQYGSHLKIGDDMLLTASSTDANYVFDSWAVSPNPDKFNGSTTVTAKFKPTEEGTVVVTATVNNANYGDVYPKNPVTVEAGDTIKDSEGNPASTTSVAVYLGNETFSAVSKNGWSFHHWELFNTSSGTEIPWGGEIDDNITLKACFVDLSGEEHCDIGLATPANGSYEKTFETATLSVPKGGSYKIKGDTITFGGGVAYVKAIPDKGYEFAGWYDAAAEDESETLKDNFNVTSDKTIYASFTYIKDPIYIEDPKNTGGGSSGGGGGSSVPGDPNSKNYHAENTYGSMDDPVSDGEWELLSDGTWKYNWSKPMANAWACVVNPYAKPEQGQSTHDWFFFDPNGIMLTGWVLIDGKWYYLEPISTGCKGRLYTNTTTPDGYKVDANGAWIK